MSFKIPIIFAGMSLYACAGVMIPPSVPVVSQKSENADTFRRNDPCRLIPPMIINLPPPLEEARSACILEKMKPDGKNVSKLLKKKFKRRVKVEKIEGVEGFSDLYEIRLLINGKKTTIFCDAFLKHCIEGEKRW